MQSKAATQHASLEGEGSCHPNQGTVKLMVGGLKYEIDSAKILKQTCYFTGLLNPRFEAPETDSGYIVIHRDGIIFEHVFEYLQNNNLMCRKFDCVYSRMQLLSIRAEFDFYNITIDRKLKHGEESQDCVVILGGTSYLTSKMSFHAEQEVVVKLEEMPTLKSAFGVVSLRGTIFVLGGQDIFSNALATVESYSLEDGQWHNDVPLPQQSKHHGSVVVDGTIYVAGGQQSEADMHRKPLDGENTCNFIARIETKFANANRWVSRASTPIATRNACLCAVRNNIYLIEAVDGFSEVLNKNRIFEYDTLKDVWTEFVTMPVEAVHLITSVMNGCIYFVAYDIHGRKCLRFDPIQKTFMLDMAETLQNRSESIACVLGGYLYSIGVPVLGTNQLKTVERYNSDDNSWTTLKIRIGQPGIVAVTNNDSNCTYGVIDNILRNLRP
jgi:hypothetical protein